jgi:ribose transport system ATP-binding protein
MSAGDAARATAQGGAPPPRLSVTGLCKRFDRTTALDHVDFSVAAGEVHALLGANGAGKSTLIRVLAGAIEADAGVVQVDGRRVEIRSPGGARALGIHVIHQQLSVIEALSVAENFLVRQAPAPEARSAPAPEARSAPAPEARSAPAPEARSAASGERRALLPSRKEAEREAALWLGHLGASTSPSAPCERLGFSERQLVEIAVAMSGDVRVLIMDEPTSGLSAREQGPLLSAIARLKEASVAIVYVSHKLDEVYRIADRITVLREGRKIASFARGEVEPRAVITAIVGRDLQEGAPQAARGRAALGDRPALSVRSLRADRVRGASLEIRPGEIVGLYGVVGAGCAELLESIWGARPSRGVVEVDGKALGQRPPAERRRRGLGFVPADHRARGVVGHLSVRENLLLGKADVWSLSLRRVSAETERRMELAVTRLRIQCRGLDQPVAELSGGNQQKVVLGRWLVEAPRVLLLEDPTQGIDVGARADIARAIRGAAEDGASVLWASSEALECAALCDRVIVMRDGDIVGELHGPDLQEHRILALASGE